MADKLTEYRMKMFKQMKEEYLLTPENNRVPHYFDKSGLPKAYTQRYMDHARQAKIDNIPEADKKFETEY